MVNTPNKLFESLASASLYFYQLISYLAPPEGAADKGSTCDRLYVLSLSKNELFFPIWPDLLEPKKRS